MLLSFCLVWTAKRLEKQWGKNFLEIQIFLLFIWQAYHTHVEIWLEIELLDKLKNVKCNCLIINMWHRYNFFTVIVILVAFTPSWLGHHKSIYRFACKLFHLSTKTRSVHWEENLVVGNIIWNKFGFLNAWVVLCLPNSPR